MEKCKRSRCFLDGYMSLKTDRTHANVCFCEQIPDIALRKMKYKRNLDERRCVKRHSKENPPILTTQLKTEPVFFTLREQGYMCAKRQKK